MTFRISPMCFSPRRLQIPGGTFPAFYFINSLLDFPANIFFARHALRDVIFVFHNYPFTRRFKSTASTVGDVSAFDGGCPNGW